MLYIIKELSLDKAGRLLITDYYKGKPPKDVGLGYDPTRKEIVIRPYDESSGLIHRKVDSKNRVSIPKWIIKKLGRNYYFAVDDTGRRSIRTRDIL